MSSSPSSDQNPSPTHGNLGFAGASLRAVRLALYLAVIIGAAVFAMAAYQALRATDALHQSQDKMVASFDIAVAAPRHLAPEYTDETGRLLADCPKDSQKQLDPDTLVLSYGEDTDLDVQPINWQQFQNYLSQVTGKKIQAQQYMNTVEDVAEIKDGKIHVVALHAADAPYLVNNTGLIPVAVLGTENGATGNHLDLAVARSSKISTLADLRGHTLTCTQPTSITGHRAAIAVLMRDAQLRPDVDYTVNYSLGQTRSIQGLAAGDYEAAALSDDKLQSLLKADRVKPTDYRIIYESPVIPRFTIGYVYNLKPELAAKVTEAILGFKNEGGAASDSSGQPMRFFAVDYKKDFEFMRKIDESFDPRLGSKKAKSRAVTETDSDGAAAPSSAEPR